MADFDREEETAEVVAAIRALGREAASAQGDLRTVEACRRIVEACVTAFGALDISSTMRGMPSISRSMILPRKAGMQPSPCICARRFSSHRRRFRHCAPPRGQR